MFLYSVLKVLLLPSKEAVVGSNGLEPSTSRLSGVRSNHLSYEPMSVAGSFPIGQTFWWRRTESNCRPPACKAGALPAELRPHIKGLYPRVSPPSEDPFSRALKIKQCNPRSACGGLGEERHFVTFFSRRTNSHNTCSVRLGCVESSVK